MWPIVTGTLVDDATLPAASSTLRVTGDEGAGFIVRPVTGSTSKIWAGPLAGIIAVTCSAGPEFGTLESLPPMTAPGPAAPPLGRADRVAARRPPVAWLLTRFVQLVTEIHELKSADDAQ